jgi:hypothetical protein
MRVTIGIPLECVRVLTGSHCELRPNTEGNKRADDGGAPLCVGEGTGLTFGSGLNQMCWSRRTWFPCLLVCHQP